MFLPQLLTFVMRLLLPICYAPPVEYMALLLANDVTFEMHEHHVKQTYRSRATIMGANGTLNLIIPVLHSGERTKVKDVRISNADKWQKLHWKSLESAYRSSPYFEFYEDDIRKFYEEPWESLVEYNLELMQTVLGWLGRPLPDSMTIEYKKETPDLLDLRHRFNPKRYSAFATSIPYYQTFQAVPPNYNVSILDLMFNLGPAAETHLLQLSNNIQLTHEQTV